MAFFKRLFSKEKPPKVEPMHGVGPLQTEAQQESTRERMEKEMSAERERRGANAPAEPKDEPPGSTP